MSSNEGSTDIRKKGGRPAGKIWNYFEKGAQVSRGYNSAICSFCGYNWATAKPSRLKKHIAYDCQKIDSDTKIKVLTLLLVEHEDSDEDLNSTSITKRKTSQTDIDEDYENFPTSEDKEIAINKALVKLFIARIDVKVVKIIENQINLTIAFDGWTNSLANPFIDYCLITEERKEYL
ncbi:hypothetical protein RclHR1_09510001 [Rhizophagus clarus]|uniref:BED-type domain-containing protein n=1 Tax=Rhizophagus clarus TaxID=94130 RepID=A0A2Z6SHU6_9GLOM|nr:hypothetical protein RclHR1_09510001 [Rhizophagus clarus]